MTLPLPLFLLLFLYGMALDVLDLLMLFYPGGEREMTLSLGKKRSASLQTVYFFLISLHAVFLQSLKSLRSFELCSVETGGVTVNIKFY